MAEKEVDKFYFFRSFYESACTLSDKKRLEFYDSMLRYVFEKSQNEISPSVSGMWMLTKPILDRSLELSEIRSIAGSRGGAPKGNNNACKNKQKQANDKQKQADKEKDKEKDKDKDKGIRNRKEDKDKAFSLFWFAYPKKKNKADAQKAFDKAIMLTDIDTILNAIEQQKHCRQWVTDNGQYIPYPATWLNRGAWDDEVEVTEDSRQRNNQCSYGYSEQEIRDAEKYGVTLL